MMLIKKHQNEDHMPTKERENEKTGSPHPSHKKDNQTPSKLSQDTLENQYV